MRKQENLNMQFQPIVKWSGSKRSQAEAIVARMPKDVDTYYEPFCGGCSVLNRLLQTTSVSVRRYVASDINADLIALWNEIKNNPEELIRGYAELWAVFNRHSGEEDFERKKEVFYTVRDRYNSEHRPTDFLFIMRTTTNGMPRYNGEGKFNNSCHFSRPGIHPSKLAKICRDWSIILKAKDVQFVVQSYDSVAPTSENCFVYLDPPYANTKGMYYGALDNEQFFSWLHSLKCKWMLSFDGRTDKEDLTYKVPQDIYVSHEYLNSGNSSFRRVIGNDPHANVEESLYCNFVPEKECLLL